MTEAVEWCTVVWQVVGEASTASSSGWSTFGVAALTGLFGVAGILLGQRNQALRESRSVRAAIIAEVAAIKALITTRGILEQLKKCEAELAKPVRQLKGETRAYQLNTAECVNIIYRANLGKLGGLSEDEATAIVRFHYLLEGVMVDLTAGGQIARGADYGDFKETVLLMEEILSIAEALTSKKLPWWRRRGHNVDV
ncbi:hypothetical protein OGV25_00615 [Pseudomonas sp. P1B16]|uniref:hypothetical protein n=1 Tax=Pseudomonas sp. P1B16 TaxID=2986074 RepID=UPI002A244C16|nr:hypothetical protein [Pseudomonas sp. P1B16]WPM26884.1 hypothetical protein OGV25_00615 [Pseudomonas sp. P1B16]